MVWPAKGPITSPFGQRDGGPHYGVDIGVPSGTPVVAVLDGDIVVVTNDGDYGNYIDVDHGNLGGQRWTTRYAHLSKFNVKVGDSVKQNRVIGDSGGIPGAPGAGNSEGQHLHFEVRLDDNPENPMKWLDGAAVPDPDEGGMPSTADEALSMEDVFAVGRAAAISSWIDLPGTTESWQAQVMDGDKSIFNDQPLLPFIEQLCEASTRHFQSLPDGSFFAFFPDYFGNYNHRKAYWNIDDIEVIDGKIELSDDNLATHVFVSGDMNFDNEVGFEEKQMSRGVFTIRDAFASSGRVLADKPKEDDKSGSRSDAGYSFLDGELEAHQFLKKYGQRPYIDDAVFIKNPAFEFFYAFTTFQLLWSKQFITQFSFTFMPELYPGGIVAFKDHGFQCYIDGVTHTFDYTGGFTTQANLTAPSAHGSSNDGIAQGMVRPFSKKRWKRDKEKEKGPKPPDFSGNPWPHPEDR
jgi:hypothetical protein